jgi:hypothetical protein
MPDPFSVWWIKMMLYAAFAAFGGMLGYLLRSINNEKPIQLGRAIVECFAAGFVGILVLFACQATNLSEQWTGMIVGVCGWLGASATIAMLETLVRKRLGIHEDSNDAPKQ